MARRILSCLAFALALPAFGADDAASTNASPALRRWTVRTLVVEGPVRTRTGALLAALRLAAGEPVEAPSAAALEARIVQDLNNVRLFYDVSARVIVDGPYADIRIHAKDKWSLFPMPLVRWLDGRWSYGLFALDGNFLGSMHQLGGFVSVTDGHWRALLFGVLRDVAVPGLTVTASLGSGAQAVYEYTSGAQSGEYVRDTTTFACGASFPVLPELTAGLRVSLAGIAFSGPGPLPRAGRERWLETSLAWDGMRSTEDWQRGARLRLAYGADAAWLGADLDRRVFSWSLAVAVHPFADHNLVLAQYGSLSSGVEDGYWLEVGGGMARNVLGLRGYHEGFYKARDLVNHQLEYRVPLWVWTQFQFTAVPFVDQASLRLHRGARWEHHASYGLALRAYLRRVLMPAFQFYAAWADGLDEWHGDVAVGMQM